MRAYRGACCATIATAIALPLAPSAAQQAPVVTAADYTRAEAFLPQNLNNFVIGGSVTPIWLPSPDGRFWYRNITRGGPEVVVIDPSKRTRERCEAQATTCAGVTVPAGNTASGGGRGAGVGGDALQAADRDRVLLHTAAPAGRFARPVAGAPEDAGEDVRPPIDHVGVAVAAFRDQPDVFGYGRVRRTSPLAVDYLMEVVWRRNVCSFHLLLVDAPPVRRSVTVSLGWSPGPAFKGRIRRGC